jgi:CBS domain containing-hemolysin-like protein
MSGGLALSLGVLLLAANAFFVGAEFALMSSRRSAIEPRAAAGDRRAVTVLWAHEHVSLMLAAAQLGVTVCSTSLGLVAEPAIAHGLIGPLSGIGLGEQAAHAIAFLVALLIVVLAHVVLGEMVPKNLAVAGPDRAVLALAPPLVALARVLGPAVRVLNATANGALRLVGVEPADEVRSAFTAAQVQSIVERSAAEGTLRDDQGLLSGSLEFSDRTAGEVMVPLADLVLVDHDVTPAQLEELVAATGFSRFAQRGPDGAISGYLHLKDVLYADATSRDLPVPAWRVRALAVVHPEDQVEQALAAMQHRAAHLARVDDDADRYLGVVFLEDILEELVGEVRDGMQHGTGENDG